MAAKGKVLVTGVSGFLGLHVARAAAEAGYAVRGTVRSVKRHKEALLKVVPSMELVEAELTSAPEVWDKACEGCTLCAHVASPFPITAPKDENELIVPAVEGTTSVLAACKRAGIKRVVVTSSIVAVSGGHPTGQRQFTATDWTDVDKAEPYPKSKTLAERAAREFAEKEGLEVATVNPSYIQGPILQARESSSTQMCKRILEGDLPMVPAIGLNVCDVRDVAEVHIKALEASEAGGRYIVDSGGMLMTQAAKLLKEKLGSDFNVKTTAAPWFAMKLVSFFDSEVASVMPRWKKEEIYEAKATVELLGRPLRPPEECIVEMARSIAEFGLAKKKHSKGAKKMGGAAAAAVADDDAAAAADADAAPEDGSAEGAAPEKVPSDDYAAEDKDSADASK